MKSAVLLTTYNGEKFVGEQLKSILTQKVSVDHIYIYDDGSTDNTVKIIRDLFDEKGIVNYELFINSNQLGWKKNFWIGLLNVKEDIVFLADQDDIWEETKTEKMILAMKKLKSENKEVGILTSSYCPFYSDENVKKISKSIMNDMNETGKVTKWPLDTKVMNVKRPGCTYLVNTNILEKVNKVWDEDQAHDALLWRCSIMLGIGYNLDNSLIRYRRHGESVINKNIKNDLTTIKRKKIATITSYLQFIDKVALEKDMFPQESLDVVRKIKKYLLWQKKYLTSVEVSIISIMKYKNFYFNRKQLLTDVIIHLKLYKKGSGCNSK